MLGFVVAEFVVVPKYTATTEILVNQKHNSDSNGQAYNNQQADIQMINAYKDIITNQVILNKVSHKLNSAKTAREYGRSYSVSAAKLKDAIKISTQQKSQVFKKHIKKIMAVNNVTIVSRAAASDSPIL